MAGQIKTDDITVVREKDWALKFQDQVKKFIEILGITRKIEKVAGETLKTYKAVGTLESGAVGEGQTIPLSEFETEPVVIGEMSLNKWAKASTAEAIMKGGMAQACNATDKKMVQLIQSGIKKNFFDVLAEGTGVAAGATFQKALANAWAVLGQKFEDVDIAAVYFMNQLDVAEYLGSANITMQTAFGMNYVENFLGLGTVFFNSQVPTGHIFATAKENIICYFINASKGDFAEKFQFTTDETGLIGIHESVDYDNMTAKTTMVSGVVFVPERIDGVIVAHIDATPTLGSLTVASSAGTAVGDTKITVTETKEAGNVYKYKVGTAAETVTYGQNVKNWTSWDGSADITAATGKILTLVECDAQYHAQKAGSATVTAKS